jgi:hypothetical protein
VDLGLLLEDMMMGDVGSVEQSGLKRSKKCELSNELTRACVKRE